jgi:hypothetical protein
MKTQASVSAILLVLASSAARAEPTPAARGVPIDGPNSFSEVSERIYAEPARGDDLPKYPGVSPRTALNALMLLGGALMDRILGTLDDVAPSDFKERAPKLLHPMGVCAEATWTIDRPTSATGLLAQGTQVPAIVRMSVAKAQNESKGDKRPFGLAIKLFPTRDKDLPIESRNVFTLDQTGLDGSPRQSFLHPDKAGDELYFTNSAPGGGFMEKQITALFGKFDSDPSRRPLHPLTQVTPDGVRIRSEDAITPRDIRFIPLVKAEPSGVSKDFRTELLSYASGDISFDIALAVIERTGTSFVRVGSLVLGTPVVSIGCDQDLHFHHHRNR